MRKHSWDVPLLSELTARNGRLWVSNMTFNESCSTGSTYAGVALALTCYSFCFQGLNIGGGGGTTREIKLRLCRDGSEAFIDYEFIVGTMLHELCHNVHGPHDTKFYGLLDTITEARHCSSKFVPLPCL